VPSLELLSSAQIRAGDLEDAAASTARILRIARGPEKQRAQALLSIIGPDAGGSLPDAARPRAALVLDHLRSGEPDAARTGAEALVEEFPDSPTVLNLLGLILLTSGEDDRAQEAFERAAAVDPEFLPAVGNLERMELRAGRVEALEQRLRTRMETGPAEQEAAIRLAQLLVRQERRDEALGLLREQVELQPDATQLRGALAALARESGRQELVLQQAAELMRLGEAGDPVAYQAAGSLYLTEQKLDEAAEAFRRWGEALPDEPQPKVALARTHYLQGRPEEAEVLVEQLRERFPASVFVNNSLVDLALERGETEAALEVGTRLRPTAPELSALLRAKVLFRDGRGEEAATVLAEAMAETPSSDLARELFLMRMRLSQQEQAIVALTGWLADHPDDTGNLQLLSATHITRGEYMPALVQLERALQLVPNDPVILNNLSWLRYELGRAGAQQLARRAHQIAPNAAEISDTLGWILIREGELEEGLALLREARAELEDNADVSYHFAYALREAGQTEAAREILREILGQTDPFMEREKAEALLKQLTAS
jgi:putative PEP-CTERM system TPR-repeat lipoprotein